MTDRPGARAVRRLTVGQALPVITILDAHEMPVEVASLARPGQALVVVAIRYYG